MDRKTLLSLVPEDKRADLITWLDEQLEDARESGHNKAGYKRREAETTINALTEEKEKLLSTVEKLKESGTSAVQAGAMVKDLEKRLAALQAEHDKVLPVVQKHRKGILETAVIKTAKIKDPLVAKALIGEMGISLEEDDSLSEETTKALQAWAKDPENLSRVQSDKPAEQDAISAFQGFQSNQASGNTAAALQDPSARSWFNKLPPADRAVVDKAYAASKEAKE